MDVSNLGTCTQHPKHDADPRVQGNFGHQRGKHRGDRIGGSCIRAGQPTVKRKEGHLDSQPDEHECRPANHGLGGHQLRFVSQLLGQIGHVQRTRGRVEKNDAEQVERRAQRSQNQVAKRGHQRLAAGHTNQAVSRQRGQLQKHEHVENVAGQYDAGQTRNQKQDQRVIENNATAKFLGRDAAAVNQTDRGQDTERDQHHACQFVIDPLDSQRGRGQARANWPTAKSVSRRSVVQHRTKIDHRRRTHRYHRQQRHRPAPGAMLQAGDRHTDRRQERD